MILTLNNPDGTTIQIQPDDQSTHQINLMSDDLLNVTFSLTSYVEFQVGASTTYNGHTYTLWQSPQVSKVHSRNYAYTMTLRADAYIAQTRMFRNVVINYQTAAGSKCEYRMTCRAGHDGDYIQFLYGESPQHVVSWTFKDSPSMPWEIESMSLTDLADKINNNSTLAQTFSVTTEVDEDEAVVHVTLTGLSVGELVLVTESSGMYWRQYGRVMPICMMDYENRGAAADGQMAVNGDYRLSFPLTATPKEHLQMAVDALNYQDVINGVTSNLWTIGECIDYTETTNPTTGVVEGRDTGTEKLIAYDYVYISEALNMMAETFETEWEIQGKTISLHKVEYAKTTPLEMAYGVGNGFLSGGTKSNAADFPAIDIVDVQGSDQNIDPTTYGPWTVQLHNQAARSIRWNGKSKTLLLPVLGRIWYEGDTNTYYPYESSNVPETARLYGVTDDRQSVVRLNPTTLQPMFRTYTEASFDATDIYPQRVGKVTSVDTPDLEHVTDFDSLPLIGNTSKVYETDDDHKYYVWRLDDAGSAYEWQEMTGKNAPLYDFYDAAVDCPDYSECSIKGEVMTVVFQSGQLAGKEFDLNTRSNGTVINDYVTGRGRKFEIVPQEIDGQVMPSPIGGFYPKVGDKYAIFHCKLPASYIREDSNLSGAEWDMFRAAVQYLWQNEEPTYTFAGTVDPIWYNDNQSTVEPYMHLGWHIKFQDDILANGLLLRVTGTQTNLNNPLNIKLTITNALKPTGLGTTITKQRGNRLIHDDHIRYRAIQPYTEQLVIPTPEV